MPPAASLSVLIVDDFRDSAESLADLLQICGHGVQTAYDPEAALAAEHPNVAILGLRLPGTSGWELDRRLLGRFGDLQSGYIAMTTCGLAQGRQRSAEVGSTSASSNPSSPRC